MAIQALKPARLIVTKNGGAGESDKLDINTAEVFIPGDLLVKVNNKLTRCGADPVAISYIASCTETQAVPGDTRVVVQRIQTGESYVMNAYSGTASLAVIADSALDAKSDYGVALVTVSGSTAWVLDIDDTTNIKVRLLSRIDAATDTYPQCVVEFLPTALTFA
jgi:hypothetical protein